MNINIRAVKTFCVEMTETQARDLLRLSVAINEDDAIVRQEINTLETLNDLRQALLATGLTLTKDAE